MRFLLTIALITSLGVHAAAEEGEYDSVTAASPEELAEKTEAIAAALSGLDIPGWAPAGPVERYVVANLYDKINGRSELFMAYGVAGLAFVTLKSTDDSSKYIDIFLYDMTSVPGAFGVYSVERWPDQDAIDVGREGYRNDNDVFFWKGPYYASILGSGDEPAVRDAQARIASKLAENLRESDEPLWGFDAIPKDRVVHDTIQYFMVDALSLSFMRDTYTAEFRVGDETVSAFVSRADSEDDARARRDDFVAYMKAYGSEVESIDGATAVVVANMGGGYHDAIFVKGAYVGGVTAVPDRAAAVAAANAWHDALTVARDTVP